MTVEMETNCMEPQAGMTHSDVPNPNGLHHWSSHSGSVAQEEEHKVHNEAPAAADAPRGLECGDAQSLNSLEPDFKSSGSSVQCGTSSGASVSRTCQGAAGSTTSDDPMPGVLYGLEGFGLNSMSAQGIAPLSPPLLAALGGALHGRDSLDSGAALTGVVLSELASSALEILQQEQTTEEHNEVSEQCPPPLSLASAQSNLLARQHEPATSNLSLELASSRSAFSTVMPPLANRHRPQDADCADVGGCSCCAGCSLSPNSARDSLGTLLSGIHGVGGSSNAHAKCSAAAGWHAARMLSGGGVGGGSAGGANDMSCTTSGNSLNGKHMAASSTGLTNQSNVQSGSLSGGSMGGNSLSGNSLGGGSMVGLSLTQQVLAGSGCGLSGSGSGISTCRTSDINLSDITLPAETKMSREMSREMSLPPQREVGRSNAPLASSPSPSLPPTTSSQPTAHATHTSHHASHELMSVPPTASSLGATDMRASGRVGSAPNTNACRITSGSSTVGSGVGPAGENAAVQPLPGEQHSRFARSTPKTPPRKKCEHCAALNPTARQYCLSCGARFNIKQKKSDAPRVKPGGSSDDLPAFTPLPSSAAASLCQRSDPKFAAPMCQRGDSTMAIPNTTSDLSSATAAPSSATPLSSATVSSAAAIGHDSVGGGCYGSCLSSGFLSNGCLTSCVGTDCSTCVSGSSSSGCGSGGNDSCHGNNADGYAGCSSGDGGSCGGGTCQSFSHSSNSAGGGSGAAGVFSSCADGGCKEGGGSGSTERASSRWSEMNEPQARRRSYSSACKNCPACGQVNQLSSLSCILCGVKFSVKHTALLLDQRYGRDEQRVGARYAELEPSVDGMVALHEQVSSEVSSDSFKQLPLEAQIQVMQEKAAQRLLAQTLHQQMVQELHKNPTLAADPEQQMQFRRLAQQQLLYQMAIACQAAEPTEQTQMSDMLTSNAHSHYDTARKARRSVAERLADWSGSEYGDDDHAVPYQIEDVVFDDPEDDEDDEAGTLHRVNLLDPSVDRAAADDELLGARGAVLLKGLDIGRTNRKSSCRKTAISTAAEAGSDAQLGAGESERLSMLGAKPVAHRNRHCSSSHCSSSHSSSSRGRTVSTNCRTSDHSAVRAGGLSGVVGSGVVGSGVVGSARKHKRRRDECTRGPRSHPDGVGAHVNDDGVACDGSFVLPSSNARRHRLGSHRLGSVDKRTTSNPGGSSGGSGTGVIDGGCCGGTAGADIGSGCIGSGIGSGCSSHRAKGSSASNGARGMRTSDARTSDVRTEVRASEVRASEVMGRNVNADALRPSRRERHWLSAKAEEERATATRMPTSASSQRLLKQLADFNPPGKDDSAPNMLLPNERTTRDRGTSWHAELFGHPTSQAHGVCDASLEESDAESLGEMATEGQQMERQLEARAIQREFQAEAMNEEYVDSGEVSEASETSDLGRLGDGGDDDDGDDDGGDEESYLGEGSGEGSVEGSIEGSGDAEGHRADEVGYAGCASALLLGTRADAIVNAASSGCNVLVKSDAERQRRTSSACDFIPIRRNISVSAAETLVLCAEAPPERRTHGRSLPFADAASAAAVVDSMQIQFAGPPSSTLSRTVPASPPLPSEAEAYR